MDVLTAILAVFSAIGDWLVGAIPGFFELFYVTSGQGAGSLTFLGVLAVAGLAFSVVFLCIGVIQGFLHFRGVVQNRVRLPGFLDKIFAFFG